VGKSSLLNALLGEERVIVSEVPGTTRDAIDTQLEYANRRITLIDTAGIRRRGRIVPGVEQYSVLRAMQAIERCDVALLVLDASQPVASQDTHIAGYVLDAGKSIVLVANKWDLVSSAAAQQEWLAEVRDAFKFASYAPVACVSAKTGYGLDGMMEHVFTVASARQKRISDAELSQMVRQALLRVNPPSKGGQRLRIFSFRQVGVAPPRFLALVNEPKLAHFSFTRYLENQVRALYPFPGTPLQIEYARKQDSNRR
jgi:GTP-binding protein